MQISIPVEREIDNSENYVDFQVLLWKAAQKKKKPALNFLKVNQQLRLQHWHRVTFARQVRTPGNTLGDLVWVMSCGVKD